MYTPLGHDSLLISGKSPPVPVAGWLGCVCVNYIPETRLDSQSKHMAPPTLGQRICLTRNGTIRGSRYAKGERVSQLFMRGGR